MSESTAARVRVMLGALALVALCAAAFGPALSGAFLAWDDADTLLGHTRWRGLGPAELRWMFTTLHLGPYQPLAWLSYALDFELWGLDARAFHATNLALHAASAVLAFLCARALFARRWSAPQTRAARDLGAFAAAALFALHPLRVESVCWITERRDVLAGVFLLGSLRAWLAWSAQPARRRCFWLAFALYVASLLAKASALGWPLVLFALDVWVLGRRAWRAQLAEALLFALPALVLALVALAGQGALPGAMASWQEHGLLARAAQACYGWAFYLVQTLVVRGVQPLYELVLPLDLREPRFVAALLVVPLVCGAAWLARARAPAAWCALAAYTLLAAPLLGFAQTGAQLVAARYSYQPALAPAFLVGALVCALATVRRAWLAPLAGAVALVSALLVGASHADARHWRDDRALWTHALELDPANRGATRNLIAALYAEAKTRPPAERRPVLEQALALALRAPRAEEDPELQNARAGVLAALADLDAARAPELRAQALTALRRAVELAERTGSDGGTAALNLAALLLRLDRPAEAVPILEAATRRNPRDASAWAALGHAQTELGRAEPALAALGRALELDPDLTGATLERGLVRVALGQGSEARRDFQTVRDLVERRLGPAAAASDPDWIEASAQLERLGAGGR